MLIRNITDKLTMQTMSNKKILAIIPARGGSKGLPKKNIYPLAGKPLLAWTIEAALNSKFINRVVVSSDDKKILEIAEKHGAEPIERPAEISSDNSPYNLLIFHALEELEKRENYIPDILVYLQPTSPLRDSENIDRAMTLLTNEADCVISVYEIDNKCLKSFLVGKNGYLHGISNNQFPSMNRQDLPPVFMPNGAIYIIKREIFQKTSRLFADKTAPFIMSRNKNLDIDSIEDLKKAEKILKLTARRAD